MLGEQEEEEEERHETRGKEEGEVNRCKSAVKFQIS